MPEPARSKFEQELELERKATQYREYILNRLREFGYEGRLSLISSEIKDALQELNVEGFTTQRDRDMIDVVVRLHREAQNSENPYDVFDESVARLVNEK